MKIIIMSFCATGLILAVAGFGGSTRPEIQYITLPAWQSDESATTTVEKDKHCPFCEFVGLLVPEGENLRCTNCGITGKIKPYEK